LRQAVEDLPDGLAPGMLAGEPVMITDGFRYLEEDGQRLGWWTTALLALVIVICFRSLRWVVIAVAVVQWTLIVTQATLAWSGVRLSMVSSMLSAILTVVGIATVVHIIVVLREQFSAGLTDADHPLKQPANASPALQALQRAGILLAIPIFWSCLTDSVGFASLLSARLGPVQDFGLMSALGVLLVLAAVTLIIPGFALVGPVEDRPQRMWGEARMETQLARAIAWVDRHPAPLLLAFAAASLVALVGSLRMDVETDFTKNFRPNSPVVRSYQFVETYLGGAGVWDVVLPAPEVITEEYLDQVLALEKSLRAITITDTATGKQRPGLTKVISIADVDQAAQASRAAALLPARTRLSAMHAALPTFVSALLTQQPDEHGQRYLRIMLRASERQPAHEKNQLISQVQQLAQAAFPAGQNAPAAEVTGFFVLLTHLIDSMLADQWITFGVSTVGITLMLLVALRSAKLAVIAQIPNLFPILWTLGFMGWLGMKMNMGAAMIAAVSLGLSVDTSIHYILEYQAARRHGLNCMQALYRAQQGVGRALVFSTLALVAGFSVLATSQFIPTVYFGILVSLAMLGGLLGNLLILPLLIRLTTRD
jgi:predicted RND superfamily exporter protein